MKTFQNIKQVLMHTPQKQSDFISYTRNYNSFLIQNQISSSTQKSWLGIYINMVGSVRPCVRPSVIVSGASCLFYFVHFQHTALVLKVIVSLLV